MACIKAVETMIINIIRFYISEGRGNNKIIAWVGSAKFARREKSVVAEYVSDVRKQRLAA